MSDPLSDAILDSIESSALKATPSVLYDPSEVLLLVAEVRRQRAEIIRLKEGDFTPAEIQQICHNLKGCDRATFEDGCREYQDKLFGPREEKP